MLLCVGLYAYRIYKGVFRDTWKNVGLAWFLFVALSAVGHLFLPGMREAQLLQRCHFGCH